MSEFSLIECIRRHAVSERPDVALGIGDDAALLDVRPGRQLVVCTDSLVEGVHFLPGTAPADIGWKALAVNLSDLAAMGAEPAWALLALTLPEADTDFVEGFAGGFAELAHAQGVALVGGDTTQGSLAVTVTALGLVPRESALTRRAASVGDVVFVTGSLGDAAAALQLLRSVGKSHPPQSPFRRKGEDKLHPLPQEGGRRTAAGGCRSARLEVLCARLHRPEPRIAAGLALRGIASACIDVSDGLLADLGHVCKASGVGVEVNVDALPISAALREGLDDAGCRGLALAGGDDYELCFSVADSLAGEVAGIASALDLRITRIGRVVSDGGVRVLDADGRVVETPHAGWEHFTR